MINIKIVGVGGGGGNSVINIYDKINEFNLGIEFISVNTDQQALGLIGRRKIKKILVGQSEFGGRGVGGQPILAYKHSKENIEEFDYIFRDNPDIVFFTLGLGGGTGSGVAPVILEQAKKRGVLTIVFATYPWEFEGKMRIDNALKSLNTIEKFADSIIISNNDYLLDGDDKSVKKLFEKTDEWLKFSVLTIASLILEKSVINIDFNDIKTALKNSGFGFFFITKDRLISSLNTDRKTLVVEQTKQIYDKIKEVRIRDLDVSQSKYLVVNVSGNEKTLSMEVLTEVFKKIKSDSQKLDIIFGLSFNEYMDNNEIQISGIYNNVKYNLADFSKQQVKKTFDSKN